jgi:hypothetical protein
VTEIIGIYYGYAVLKYLSFKIAAETFFRLAIALLSRPVPKINMAVFA